MDTSSSDSHLDKKRLCSEGGAHSSRNWSRSSWSRVDVPAAAKDTSFDTIYVKEDRPSNSVKSSDDSEYETMPTNIPALKIKPFIKEIKVYSQCSPGAMINIVTSAETLLLTREALAHFVQDSIAEVVGRQQWSDANFGGQAFFHLLKTDQYTFL